MFGSYFFRAYIKNGSVLSVSKANAREPLFQRLPGVRHYGVSLIDVLTPTSSTAARFLETDFAVMYDGAKAESQTASLAISSGSSFEAQVRGAFYAEYALATGKLVAFIFL